MKKQPTILVADRNPHVRKYLERKLTGAGYQVRLAENCRQLIFWADQQTPVSLIIVDPDFPDSDTCSLVATIKQCSSRSPIVV